MVWELKVVFAPFKHCFVSVPKRVAETLLPSGVGEAVVLRLTTRDWQTGQECALLASWCGGVCPEGELRLSSHLWRALCEGSVVSVERLVTPPRSSAVLCVEPLSCDDWEVLELNAGYLEDQILSQLFVVSLGQQFPLWIFGKQIVMLCVKSLDCGASGVLRNNTSFVVEPKERRTKKPVERPAQTSASIRPVELRVLPSDWLSDLAEGVAASACEDWRDGVLLSVAPILSVASVMASSNSAATSDDGDASHSESKSRLAAASVVVRAEKRGAVPRGCVALRAETMMAMQLRPYSRVLLTSVTKVPSPPPERLRVLLFSRKRVPIANQWRAMCQNQQLVLSDGCMVVLEPGLLARVEFEKPEEESFTLASSATKSELSLRYASATPMDLEEVRALSPKLADLIGARESSLSLFRHLQFFVREPEKFGKLALVCGGIGFGKTAIVRAVCGSVDRLYTEILDCTVLCTEKISSVRTLLSETTRRCHSNFPSVLVLENLHLLCPASTDDEVSVRPQQLANALVSLLRSAKTIAVATAPNPESISGLLRHPFVCGTVIALKGPTREERRELANALLKSLRHVVPVQSLDETLDLLADASDGFAPGDMRQLLHRIPRDKVCAATIEDAKKLSTPSSLAGIKLHKSSLQFAQIGGLEDAKQILRETFGYPKLHAKLLSKSPIKLPTGALLYGPPGSGKTMLASAAPQEFGLNAICVSGPELLSKYIGQSEQSVRELFQRAKQCKPSLIVFDEFDSLAPKRGHDSTGVTDRVVNQLLTQLDGVEGRENVFVLAVSSRPDLIDPALLRPGRLDRLVFVNEPDERARRDILQLVCASAPQHSDVNFDQIAAQTVHFSGADLQALAYNARLLAAHERLDAPSERNEEQPSGEAKRFLEIVRGDHSIVELAVVEQTESLLAAPWRKQASRATNNVSEGEELTVCERHWSQALRELRPSVSEADRSKLSRIYAQFQQSKRGADFKAGLEENGPKQTLM